MAMSEFRVPTPEEKKILTRQGIEIGGPGDIVITHWDSDLIRLRRQKTGVEIWLRAGYKKWW